MERGNSPIRQTLIDAASGGIPRFDAKCAGIAMSPSRRAVAKDDWNVANVSKYRNEATLSECNVGIYCFDKLKFTSGCVV